MNNLRNKVQLIGNLGMDPEIKEISEGRKMARFTLATNEAYRNAKGERIKETQWHNLVAWGPRAAFVEKFLNKGKEIALEGKLVHRNYEDKEGKKRYITEVQVSDFLMLGKNPQTE
jgi:single-strand DNA-binding protein